MKKREKILCKEFCTGCGLCCNLYKIPLVIDQNGFPVPDFEKLSEKQFDELKNICPCFGGQCDLMDENYIWGRRTGVFTAYASDSDVRYRASSGGILTQLCCYLIEEKKVDGILHIGKNPDDPIGSKLFLSTTSEEVISHCGSRYASSSPLKNISDFIEKNKKYCFVGKPCDVAAIRNLFKIKPELEQQIPFLLSFFCAGAPSRNANLLLLDKMGCKYDECKNLDYRGNGWPGYATSYDKNGNKYKIEYREAWGKTLGRDIRKICRFCIDGLGEAADISCCDAWYLTDDKKPSFEEHDGRNAVFCRTNKGLELFKAACKSGYISIIDNPDCEKELMYAQYHQYFKKGSMIGSIYALRHFFKPYPKFDKRKLKKYTNNISKKMILQKYIGTIKRILKGKI